MKGFPTKPPGPPGPWLSKVNQAIAGVSVGLTRAEVEGLLGPADELRENAAHPSEPLQALMEELADGPTSMRYGAVGSVELVLLYRDPYRPRRRYHVVFSAGRVVEVHRETTDATRATRYRS